MSTEKELLIFGLDGVTYNLLDTWFEEGKLPYLQEFVSTGVRADMESTIPPVTGPAWTTFQTGVNPGKHGVFDWGSSDQLDYGKGTVDSSSIKTKTIWALLSEKGKRVGSIGLPVTYPPKEVNGFITTGVLTPKDAEDYVYPSELRKGLEKEVGGYKYVPTHAEMSRNRNKWVSELKKTITNKEQTALHLLTSQEWDVALVYFMETDTVNHHLYHKNTADPKNSTNGNLKGDPVLEVYKRVEKAVKSITEAVARENTNVMIISDHGFGPLKWIFNVNSWLLKKGYLSLKGSFLTKLKKMASRLGFNQKNLYKAGDFLGPLAKGNEWELERFSDILGKIFLSFDDVDWRRTKVYSWGGVTGGLRLNIKGREKHGCVPPGKADELQEQLIEDLKKLKNPYNGQRVVDIVLKNEEVYEGPWRKLGPDLLFLTKDLKTDTGGLTLFKTLQPIIPAFAVSGTHRMNGIFAANGPKFNQAKPAAKMEIVDPASIILYLLGLEIPNYMDGKLREETFSPNYWANNPPRYVDLRVPGSIGKEKKGQGNRRGQRKVEGIGIPCLIVFIFKLILILKTI